MTCVPLLRFGCSSETRSGGGGGGLHLLWLWQVAWTTRGSFTPQVMPPCRSKEEPLHVCTIRSERCASPLASFFGLGWNGQGASTVAWDTSASFSCCWPVSLVVVCVREGGMRQKKGTRKWKERKATSDRTSCRARRFIW